MTLTRKAFSVIGALIAALSLLALVAFKGVDVSISQAEVQALILKRLPFDGKKLQVSYRVDGVSVGFLPDGRVDIVLSARLSTAGRAAEVEASGRATPVYRAGKVYLDEFEIVSVAVHKVTGEVNREGPLSKLAEAGRKALEKVLDKEAGAALFEAVREDLARAVVGKVFEIIPVYELKPTDLKHSAALLLLQSVHVADGVMVLTLHPLGGLRHMLLVAVVFLATAVVLVALAPLVDALWPILMS